MDKNFQTLGISALEVGELDLFVDSMEPSLIENIGSPAWIDWHIRLQKLNQQAVLEASSLQEELTKETLISCGKLPVLVHEAICIQVWKNKIYPQIMKMNPSPENTFGIYMVLYHEAAAVGLLETVLFHEAGAQCARDVSADLLQYAVEQLTALVGLINTGFLSECQPAPETESVGAELTRQRRQLQFDISMRAISLVRYITEHAEAAGAGAATAAALFGAHDLPALLSHLLLAEPWVKRSENGEMLYFNYGRWSREAGEPGRLHRCEAQLWLCLRQLLLDPRLPPTYAADAARRDAFCRLQSKMSESMLDQLPPLGELRAFLCRLSVGDLGAAAGARAAPAVIELVPQIKRAYLSQVHKRAKAVAASHLSRLGAAGVAGDGAGEGAGRELARRLLESYASEAALALDGGGARCAGCGRPAARRCARCRGDWYCGRECQVKSWPRHKEICDQLAKMCV